MRVTGRTIVIVVAVAGALAFVMGWVVTREVRATARRTDARLELLADVIVAHAKSHGGDMPTSEQALRSGLPAGAAADPELEAALRFLQVAWPPDPSLAPILGANGLPTGIGTLPRVNDRLRASARGSVPNPAAQVSAPAP